MARASSRLDPAHPAPALTREAIRDGAAALGLSLPVEAAERLGRFAALLMRWGSVHNLTAIRSPADVLSHHLLDSLAIVRPIDSIFVDRQPRVLDVGAGGGLPGIPLAIARPAWPVALVDKVAKKVAFLTQAKLELGLPNLQCVQARAEDLQHAPFDLIVSRAFATLADFVRVSGHLLAPGGWWAAMKGVHPTEELAALAHTFPEVRVVDIVKLDVPRLDAERHLVLLQRP